MMSLAARTNSSSLRSGLFGVVDQVKTQCLLPSTFDERAKKLCEIFNKRSSHQEYPETLAYNCGHPEAL